MDEIQSTGDKTSNARYFIDSTFGFVAAALAGILFAFLESRIGTAEWLIRFIASS